MEKGKGRMEKGKRIIEQIVRIETDGNETKAEVVGTLTRCFECEYHYKDGDNVVTSHCLLNHNHVQPSDWFCADGERKETEDGT